VLCAHFGIVQSRIFEPRGISAHNGLVTRDFGIFNIAQRRLCLGRDWGAIITAGGPGNVKQALRHKG
jgi:hypothetical protein